ncbi:TonB-dependent receptor [Fulvivirga sp. M361]|uniref:SusC/RagA family TonB-linked outer membrane protein n=1 Tax=Fulvivirga sp. M361 TaxID=2594266 RepID=UPI00117B65B4|nr:TonB-dependent receptor [Fulvivirga sp. M361]TRX59920.1 TonB-dependent receptor [Fulvivirga sp. M361]
MKKTLLLTFIMLAVFGMAEAQNTVTGKVTDGADGAAIPGVNVVEKGTTNGTVTDFNGNYTLSIADGATILFSFVGYVTQEIPAAGKSVIDISLSTDVQQLSEVVVIGYGTQEADDVTGAISSIDAENFNPGVISSPEQLFEGKLAGVQVSANSGEPGAGINVNIRGFNSIRSTSQPLFVVDGVPITSDNPNAGGVAISSGSSSAPQNPLSFLNPDDIASIDILKDASAAAIFGSRAANGVVLITTKQGQSGSGTLEYSSYGSVAFIRNKLDLLDAGSYENAIRQLADEAETPDQRSSLLENLAGGDVDYQDEIFRVGVTQSHNLSYGGGTEDSRYRISLGYLDQEGVVENSRLERYTARINSNHKALNDRVSIDLQLTATRTETLHPPIEEGANATGDLIINALRANPTSSPFEDDGSVVISPSNPLALLEFIDDNSEMNRVLGNVSVGVEIVEGLSYKFNMGGDAANSERRTDFSALLPTESNSGSGTINVLETSSLVFDNTLNYVKTFGEDHRIDFLVGHSYQQFRRRGSFISRGDPILPTIDITPNIAFALESNNEPTSFLRFREIQSYFGRVNYDFRDKYLFTATVRVDESSVFGPRNSSGTFPSFSAGWRLSEETFIQDLDVFSNLKLRVGYGILGSQDIPERQQVFAFSTDATTRFINGNDRLPGLALIRTPNPDLKWEEQRQFNIGIDFGLFDGRLTGSFDYFNKSQDDLLVFIPTIQPAPTSGQFQNIDGDIRNTGFEITLSSVNINQGDFSWNTDFNLTSVQPEVRGLVFTRINGAEASGQGLSGTIVQYFTNGQAPFVFLGREFTGVDASGNPQFVQNENGADDQFRVLGDPIPNTILGLTNSFRYKKFDLTFLLSAQLGFEVYNNTANSLFTASSFRSGSNVTEDVANEALSSGETGGNPFSSRFIEDGDFLRLTNATIGYTFDVSKVSWLNSMRVYLAGQNLFLITNYTGYDPEVNSQPNATKVNSVELPSARGIDNSSYPRPSTVQLGLNVRF